MAIAKKPKPSAPQAPASDLGAALLEALAHVKSGGGKVSAEFLTCAGGAGLIVAKRITAQHKAQLIEQTGKTLLPVGRCTLEDGKLTFVQEGAPKGLAKKLQDAIRKQTGKGVDLHVRDASTSTVQDAGQEEPSREDAALDAVGDTAKKVSTAGIVGAGTLLGGKPVADANAMAIDNSVGAAKAGVRAAKSAVKQAPGAAERAAAEAAAIQQHVKDALESLTPRWQEMEKRRSPVEALLAQALSSAISGASAQARSVADAIGQNTKTKARLQDAAKLLLSRDAGADAKKVAALVREFDAVTNDAVQRIDTVNKRLDEAREWLKSALRPPSPQDAANAAAEAAKSMAGKAGDAANAAGDAAKSAAAKAKGANPFGR